MNTKHVFTGSCETEEQLRRFAGHAKSLDVGVRRSIFTDDYMWKVMTTGRCGAGEAREGSEALDDTGGFFEMRDGMVYLTDKAKSCIRI